MRHSRDDPGHGRIATIDIETTHYEPARGETVSVGLGVHERGAPGDDATYDLLHRDGSGEADLIRRAFRRLDGIDADVLVSYNGRGFDLRFLQQRLDIRGVTVRSPALHTPESHLDLFADRKERADRRSMKWPALEECVESYGWTPAKTIWGSEEVDNARFGAELGPAYLEALEDADGDRVADLADVIEHYLVADLEANIAIYYGDIDEEFRPAYLGTEASFPT